MDCILVIRFVIIPILGITILEHIITKLCHIVVNLLVSLRRIVSINVRIQMYNQSAYSI